jgi:hypothetical protein
MGKGKKLEILKEIQKQYNITTTNKQYKEICAHHITHTYTIQKIYNLMKAYKNLKNKI